MSVPATPELQAGINALTERQDAMDESLEALSAMADALAGTIADMERRVTALHELTEASVRLGEIVRDALSMSSRDTDDR